MNIVECVRLRQALKTAGCNGEYRSIDGRFEWLPRGDSTEDQLSLAKKIISEFKEAGPTDRAETLRREDAKTRLLDAVADQILANPEATPAEILESAIEAVK